MSKAKTPELIAITQQTVQPKNANTMIYYSNGLGTRLK